MKELVTRIREFMVSEARSCSMDTYLVQGNFWFTVNGD